MKRPKIGLGVGLVLAVTGFFLMIFQIYFFVAVILIPVGCLFLLSSWWYLRNPSPPDYGDRILDQKKHTDRILDQVRDIRDSRGGPDIP